METAKDSKVEAADKPGQANSQTANDPKGGKTTSGLGLKGGLADMFPDDAPVHQMGKALAAVGIVVDGKLTNNQAKVDVGMQVLSDGKVQNMQLLGTLMGVRAPGKVAGAPSLTVSQVKASPPVDKTYQTYTKTNPKTGEVYTGRCSGNCSPEQNVARRDAGHHMTEKGFGPAVTDRSSKNPDAIRGREQQVMDANGGAKSTGGTSGNAINGISQSNPKGQEYRNAADREFK